MNNRPSICQHYCLLSTNQCYYCHISELESSYRYFCCCPCSISFEEVLTWIVICSLTFLLYNTIKLCIIIFLILFLIYWICKKLSIFHMFKEFYERLWIKSKAFFDNKPTDEFKYISSINKQNLNDNPIQDNNIDHDEDNQKLNDLENDKDQQSFLTATLSNSIENTQDQIEFSSDVSQYDIRYNLSISQPGYYGPIHTIMSHIIKSNNEDHKQNSLKFSEISSSKKQIEQKSKNHMMIKSQIFFDASQTSIVSNKFSRDEIQDETKILTDIIEQTKGIRQMIEILHENILQLKQNSNTQTIDQISNLSIEEKKILKLATENLIQTIISTRMNKNTTILKQSKKHSSKELIKTIQHYEKQKSSPLIFNDDHQQSEAKKSKQSSILEIDNLIKTQLPEPKCVTLQTSFVMNSSIPHVPTKATVININNDDDEEIENSYNDDIIASQYIITTNEQFENIPTRNEQKSENDLFLKQDSRIYDDEPVDWISYTSKPDHFPNVVTQSDLPIAQSDEQHSSFKQTLFSHFHRGPNFTLTNIPATFHSSSLNATNIRQKKINSSCSISYLPLSINSNNNPIKYQYNTIKERQKLAEKLLDNKESFNYIWNKTLNHLKQRIFRVRKSRILISFDDTQQQKNANNDDKNIVDTLVDTVVEDMSTEINHVRSQLHINRTNSTFINPSNNNKQELNVIRNGSMMSLFQSFDSVIREGELSLYNDKQYKSRCQNENVYEDSVPAISNSLYSVTSQFILS
ncbi:unnamed protein product [Rotaria sp. Silwood1]|nr:unnamed protein product [Rotaria sp. Silwood1]